MNTHSPKGFTIVELLAVVTIAVVIATFAIVGIRNYAAYQQYNQAVTDVRIALQQVRNDARHTVDGVGRGVYITVNELTFYSGTTYDAMAADNVLLSYPNIEFYPTLSNSVIDISFAPLTGYANASGTIAIVGTGQHIDSTVITIASSGVIK